MKLILNKNWKAKIANNDFINSNVPGDIYIDFYKSKHAPNPYIAKNFFLYKKVQENGCVYQTKIKVGKSLLKSHIVNLVFEGIDLFSTIYLNGEEVGKTNNAFLKYVFPVKENLVEEENILEEKMSSTIKYIRQF